MMLMLNENIAALEVILWLIIVITNSEAIFPPNHRIFYYNFSDLKLTNFHGFILSFLDYTT